MSDESNKKKYFLLSANYWKPKTNQKNGRIDYMKFEKIQIEQNNFYYTIYKNNYYINCEDQPYIQIKNSKTNTIKKITFQKRVFISIQTIVNQLKQNGIDNVQYLDGNIIINSQFSTSYDIKTNLCGLQFNNIQIYSNRIIECSSYIYDSYPVNLTWYYPKGRLVFNGWETSSKNGNQQYFIMDLYQTPFEKQRRDYRIQKGSIDSSNAKCQNKDCESYGSYSISTYSKLKGKTFDKTSTTCPFCKSPLTEGVKKIDSDGIMTYIYDGVFVQDQIIKVLKIKINPLSNHVANAFSVFISSNLQDWQCIFSATPTFVYNEWKYMINKTYLNIDKDKSQDDKYQENDQNYIVTSLEESKIFELRGLNRGRFLKVVTLPQAISIQFNLKIQWKQGTMFQILQSEVASNYLKDITDQLLTNRIVSVSYFDSENGLTSINNVIEYCTICHNDYYIFGYLSLKNNMNNIEKFDSIHVQTKLYKSNITDFQVYGYGYKENQLKITSKPTIITQQYNYKTQSVYINCLPIQFFKVSALVNNCSQILLDQIKKYDDINNVKYYLQVVSQKFIVIEKNQDGTPKYDQNNYLIYKNKQLKYYKIVKGFFYFDVVLKRIVLPKYFYCDKNILQVDFGNSGAIDGKLSIRQQDDDGYYKFSFNQLTKNLQKWGVEVPNILPDKLNIVMWTGLQGSVNLNIRAVSNGPCYQLEKGSISFVESEEYQQKEGNKYYNGLSTPLPDLNYSGQLTASQINLSTYQRTIPWVVYNKEIITIRSWIGAERQGYFYINTYPTARTDISVSFFLNNICGGDQLSFATGVCTGQITLKGKPNTIIEGDLIVYAAPYTRRFLNNTVYVDERTGGMIGEGLLLDAKLKQQNKYRTAYGYKQPYGVAYLSQRTQDKTLQNVTVVESAKYISQ